MVDSQILSNIATIIVAILAVIGLIWEIKSSRKERNFSIFLRLIDYYNEIMTERRKKWKLIKNTNKELGEIGDKTNSLDYLLLRIQQKEPLYAIEHNLIEDEIRSLNLLNELCNYALKDEQKELILKISFSSEVSFYQNRLKDLLLILEKEKLLRPFSIPHYTYLQKFRVGDYFQDLKSH